MNNEYETMNKAICSLFVIVRSPLDLYDLQALMGDSLKRRLSRSLGVLILPQRRGMRASIRRVPPHGRLARRMRITSARGFAAIAGADRVQPLAVNSGMPPSPP